jgi:hypothetical protein
MNEFLNSKQDQNMETPKELIDATIKKVESILNTDFPEHLTFGNGSFTISRGSTQVMIIVRAFTKTETCVECTANVVTGAKVDDKLMNFLLRKNAELHFGSFALLFDNTISFSHSITGTNLDNNELTITLNAVAIIADYYDDEIVKIAGGFRALDLPNELV